MAGVPLQFYPQLIYKLSYNKYLESTLKLDKYVKIN